MNLFVNFGRSPQLPQTTIDIELSCQSASEEYMRLPFSPENSYIGDEQKISSSFAPIPTLPGKEAKQKVVNISFDELTEVIFNFRNVQLTRSVKVPTYLNTLGIQYNLTPSLK